jgi:hypothetical protein
LSRQVQFSWTSITHYLDLLTSWLTSLLTWLPIKRLPKSPISAITQFPHSIISALIVQYGKVLLYYYRTTLSHTDFLRSSDSSLTSSSLVPNLLQLG